MKNTYLKHIIATSAACILGLATAQAQNASTAIKLSQNHYEGTARSVAMGNAFTSLGGELGALFTNPAGGGLFRYCEASITPSFGTSFSNTILNGERNRLADSKFGISNVAGIASFNTGREYGLVNFNFGVSYSQTDEYNYSSYASGLNKTSSMLSAMAAATNGIHSSNLDITNSYDPFSQLGPGYWSNILFWNSSLLSPLGNDGTQYMGATENVNGTTITLGGPLQQTYRNIVNGYKGQVDLNFSGNISNKFFFGMNVGIVDLYYNYYEQYSEQAQSSSNFASGFNNFTHVNRYTTRGTGINLGFGIIYRPFKGFSIGASITTPTWMYLNDVYDQSIEANLDATASDPKPYSASIDSPLGEFKYRLNTPFRWSAGISYVIANRVALSFDYEGVDYGQTRLIDDAYGYRNTFSYDNEILRNSYRYANNVRAGVEIRATDIFSIRGGYNYYDYADNAKTVANLHTAAVGAGFSFKSGFFLDLAYQHIFNAESYYKLYNDVDDMIAPTVTSNDWRFKILLTLGIRF